MTDDTCRFIVFDFDNHEKDAEKHDFANLNDTWKEEVDILRRICELNGIDTDQEKQEVEKQYQGEKEELKREFVSDDFEDKLGRIFLDVVGDGAWKNLVWNISNI